MSNAGIQSWTFSANDNTTINGINIAENCPAANINNAIRQAMSSVMQEIAYQGADLSATASLSLASVDYRFLAMTSSASIIHAGSGRAGLVRVTKWNSASTLVGNANVLTDGGGNIVTQTNDVTMFVSFGGGVNRAINFPISGLPPSLGGSVTSSASIGDSVFGLSSAGVAKRIPASVTASAGSLVVWDAGPKYPAGDGSQITNINSGVVVQQVHTQSTTKTAGTTIIPYDNTKPQISEGTQVLSRAITPTNATHTLKIEVTLVLAPTTGDVITTALFQDSTTDALDAFPVTPYTLAGGLTATTVSHIFWMTAGTTSATTFTVRVGGTGNQWTFNGQNDTAIYGGVATSGITVTEYS